MSNVMKAITVAMVAVLSLSLGVSTAAASDHGVNHAAASHEHDVDPADCDEGVGLRSGVLVCVGVDNSQGDNPCQATFTNAPELDAEAGTGIGTSVEEAYAQPEASTLTYEFEVHSDNAKPINPLNPPDEQRDANSVLVVCGSVKQSDNS